MRSHQYYVYIATNRRGTLYTGMTNDIERRFAEHRAGSSVFTARYRIGKLVFVEVTSDVWSAIAREKQIKGWTRARKLALIRSVNPAMRDLLYSPKGPRVRKAPLPRRAECHLRVGPGGSSEGPR
jgi:putative endonuclease